MIVSRATATNDIVQAYAWRTLSSHVVGEGTAGHNQANTFKTADMNNNHLNCADLNIRSAIAPSKFNGSSQKYQKHRSSSLFKIYMRSANYEASALKWKHAPLIGSPVRDTCQTLSVRFPSVHIQIHVRQLHQYWLCVARQQPRDLLRFQERDFSPKINQDDFVIYTLRACCRINLLATHHVHFRVPLQVLGAL